MNLLIGIIYWIDIGILINATIYWTDAGLLLNRIIYLIELI